MRYFEIAKLPARHILADADQRETARGQPRSRKIETPGERDVSNSSNLISRQSRQQHLSPQRSQ